MDRTSLLKSIVFFIFIPLLHMNIILNLKAHEFKILDGWLFIWRECFSLVTQFRGGWLIRQIHENIINFIWRECFSLVTLILDCQRCLRLILNQS